MIQNETRMHDTSDTTNQIGNIQFDLRKPEKCISKSHKSLLVENFYKRSKIRILSILFKWYLSSIWAA